jgi:hypothetical protein
VLAAQRFHELDKTMHELQRLSTREFEPSLRTVRGETTRVSPSTVLRVNKQFLDDYRADRSAMSTSMSGRTEFILTPTPRTALGPQVSFATLWC